MRLDLPFLLAVFIGFAAPLDAQRNRVALEVDLGPPDSAGARKPLVRVRGLLQEERWAKALESSFAIRLTFKLEIWRSREGWIDEFDRQTEWMFVVQREPLQENYRLNLIFLAGPVERSFTDRAALEGFLGSRFEVDALPRGRGTFYYSVGLKISTLSDDELEDVERFLAGQPNAPPGERGRNPLGRGFYRFLLRVAGLPWEELEKRSPEFTVRP